MTMPINIARRRENSMLELTAKDERLVDLLLNSFSGRKPKQKQRSE